MCLMISTKLCGRFFGAHRGRKDQIPLDWISDGVVDCLSGEDEVDQWPRCGSGSSTRLKSNKTCSDVFVCPGGRGGYIELPQLCDLVYTCGAETRVCTISRKQFQLQTTFPVERNSTKSGFWCLPGLENLRLQLSPCRSVKAWNYPPGRDVFGKNDTLEITVPDQKLDCRTLYGEIYLHVACEGQCLDNTTECPLEGRVVLKDSCRNLAKKQVYTIVNNDYLTFLVKEHGRYHNRYFVCDTGNCISYDKVCDLADNCGDGSDERTCRNSFQCRNGARIRLSQVCDGTLDCVDYSDECNKHCGQEILNGVSLKVSAWVIGIFSFALNALNLSISVFEMRQQTFKSIEIMLNKFLTMAIAIGDMFTGAYLLVLSFYDIILGHTYCDQQVTWLSHWPCATLGVFSSVGSQLSVISMTILSLIRVCSIRSSGMVRGPSAEVSRKKKASVGICFALVIIFPVLLFTIPLIPQFEDFFVNGLSYDRNNTLFIGMPNKAMHTSVIEGYYGGIRRHSGTNLKWSQIRSLIQEMFSQDYSLIRSHRNSFYGNHGVCSFKFFVTRDDPQLLYVWLVLFSDVLCFGTIVISYILITIFTLSGSKILVTGPCVNQQVIQRNQQLQRKVTVIILTDFVCWIPFILVSCLHSGNCTHKHQENIVVKRHITVTVLGKFYPIIETVAIATHVVTPPNLVLIIIIITLTLVIKRINTDLLVILLKGSQILSGLGELSLLHTLADVPVDKGLFGIHQVKLLVKTWAQASAMAVVLDNVQGHHREQRWEAGS
eukprot:sb/3462301/